MTIQHVLTAGRDRSGLRLGAADPAQAEAMQRRIVETAERRFREVGYQKTTVADIAAELGMSPANVYRFFASKAAITEAVTRKVTGEVLARVTAATAEPGLPARERLRRFVRTNFAAMREHCLVEKRVHEMVAVAMAESWDVIRAHKEAMHRVLTGIVADGVAAGEFDVADPAAAAACFQYAMVALAHPIIVGHCLEQGEPIEAMMEPLLAFAFRGLGAPGPA